MPIVPNEPIDYYELTVAWINEQYKDYPTGLDPATIPPVSEAEEAETIYYTAIGENCTIDPNEASNGAK